MTNILFRSLTYIMNMNLDWYKTLNKPSYNPPSWVFRPVWMTLYLMMGISFFMMLMSTTERSKTLPILFFFIQLGFNFSWTPVFFGMHKMKAGLIIILLTIIFLLLTIVSFYPISKIASILLIPYLLWLLYAGFLNYQLVKLN